jgi:tetratricopeptide (TPR) repeat protein
MIAERNEYLAEWLRLALATPDGYQCWQDAFEGARVGWQLGYAQRLLREVKQTELPMPASALLLHEEGMFYAQRGDWARAVERLWRAVETLEDSPYVVEGIAVLNDLGMLLRLRGNNEGAVAAHEQALSLAEAIDDSILKAEAREQLGLDLEHCGQFDQAIEHFQEALGQHVALSQQETIVRTLNHLGEAYWRCGNLDAARDALTQALALVRSGHADDYLAAQIMGNLGAVAYEVGDLLEAEKRWRAALETIDALGVVFDKVGLLNNLGGLAFGRGDYDGAASYYSESLALAQELGDERGIQEATHNLAMVYDQLSES